MSSSTLYSNNHSRPSTQAQNQQKRLSEIIDQEVLQTTINAQPHANPMDLPLPPVPSSFTSEKPQPPIPTDTQDQRSEVGSIRSSNNADSSAVDYIDKPPKQVNSASSRDSLITPSYEKPLSASFYTAQSNESSGSNTPPSAHSRPVGSVDDDGSVFSFLVNTPKSHHVYNPDIDVLPNYDLEGNPIRRPRQNSSTSNFHSKISTNSAISVNTNFGPNTNNSSPNSAVPSPSTPLRRYDNGYQPSSAGTAQNSLTRAFQHEYFSSSSSGEEAFDSDFDSSFDEGNSEDDDSMVEEVTTTSNRGGVIRMSSTRRRRRRRSENTLASNRLKYPDGNSSQLFDITNNSTSGFSFTDENDSRKRNTTGTASITGGRRRQSQKHILDPSDHLHTVFVQDPGIAEVVSMLEGKRDVAGPMRSPPPTVPLPVSPNPEAAVPWNGDGDHISGNAQDLGQHSAHSTSLEGRYVGTNDGQKAKVSPGSSLSANDYLAGTSAKSPHKDKNSNTDNNNNNNNIISNNQNKRDLEQSFPFSSYQQLNHPQKNPFSVAADINHSLNSPIASATATSSSSPHSARPPSTSARSGHFFAEKPTLQPSFVSSSAPYSHNNNPSASSLFNKNLHSASHPKLPMAYNNNVPPGNPANTNSHFGISSTDSFPLPGPQQSNDAPNMDTSFQSSNSFTSERNDESVYSSNGALVPPVPPAPRGSNNPSYSQQYPMGSNHPNNSDMFMNPPPPPPPPAMAHGMSSEMEKREPVDEPRGFFSKRSKWFWILVCAIILIIILIVVLVPVGVLVIKDDNKSESISATTQVSNGKQPPSNNSDGNKNEKLPDQMKNTIYDVSTWADTKDFNTTFTSQTVGGLPVMGLFSSYEDSAQPNENVPKLSEPFPYGKMPIRGVNLGGWLILEPFLTPSFFDKYEEDLGIVDEWTLTKHVNETEGPQAVKDLLEKHYSTFVIEETFKEISEAGLDHVRIPYGYWAIDVWDDDDQFLPYVSWRYLLRGIEWARKYGLRVNIDLHSAPGGQNGWNHSGRQNVTRWLNGTDGEMYGQRTLDVHKKVAAFFSQERYDNIVTIYGLVNEPRMTALNQTIVREWTVEAYKLVQENGYKGKIVFGDGFVGVDAWKGVYPTQEFPDLVLDVHEYTIFDKNLISMPHSGKINYVCSEWASQLKRSSSNITGHGATFVGEWSQADNDCTLYLNNVNVGSRWEGDFNPGNGDDPVLTPSCHGNTGCTCKESNAHPSEYSDAYKTFLLHFAEAQMQVFEENSWGFMYWNWDTETYNSTQWAYKKAREYGIIPKIAYERSFNCSAGTPDYVALGLPETY